MHGWYSKQASDRFGHWVYLTSDDKRVLITEITNDKTCNALWNDLEYMGEVVKCVKGNPKMPDFSQMTVDQIFHHLHVRDEAYQQELERRQMVATQRLKWS